MSEKASVLVLFCLNLPVPAFLLINFTLNLEDSLKEFFVLIEINLNTSPQVGFVACADLSLLVTWFGRSGILRQSIEVLLGLNSRYDPLDQIDGLMERFLPFQQIQLIQNTLEDLGLRCESTSTLSTR